MKNEDLIIIALLGLALYLYWKHQQKTIPKTDDIIERKGKSKEASQFSETFWDARDWEVNSDNHPDWFAEQRWLNDKEIDWAFNQVFQQIPPEQVPNYKYLEATQFMFTKESLETKDTEATFSFPVLLSELTGFTGELVFIPVNNPNFHWSLLVYEPATQTFYHYDTLKGSPNQEYVRPLVLELLQQLHQENKPDLDKYLISLDQIKQNNTYDCGVAIIAITQRIIEKYSSEYDIDNVALDGVKLGTFDFNQARIDWRKQLTDQD